MNRYVIDEFHRNPALYERLVARAHRERAQAIHAGFVWLRKRLAARFDFHPGHWMERLG
mgnify:CR=1 FL=1